MIDGLCWPDQARLAVAIVVSAAAEGSPAEQRCLSARLLSTLREHQLPVTWVGGSDVPQVVEDDYLAMADAAHSGNGVVAIVGGSADAPSYRLQIDRSGSPHWHGDGARRCLILPLDPACSDRAMLDAPWWTPDEWLQYSMDSFDRLHIEGEQCARVLGLQLTPCGVGRSGAIQALQQLLGYMQQREQVWFATASSLARHCQQFGSAPDATSPPGNHA